MLLVIDSVGTEFMSMRCPQDRIKSKNDVPKKTPLKFYSFKR